MSQAVFDGTTYTIRCLDEIDELNVKELYSEWKRWIMESDNSKYLPAFHVVGGESTISDGVIEPYFFLINNWKIKPREADHMLIVKGLLFGESGINPIAPTDGPYTVTVYKMTPTVTATTINYGEIQTAALDDMMATFVDSYIRLDAFQKQQIRDALLMNPSDGLVSELNSIDTRLERVDLNTQRFGTEMDNLTVTVDTSLLENRMSAVSVKVDNVRDLVEYNRDLGISTGDKVDLLVHRNEIDRNKISDTHLTADEIKEIMLDIQTKINAL